jgi:hypothetical protein
MCKPWVNNKRFVNKPNNIQRFKCTKSHVNFKLTFNDKHEGGGGRNGWVVVTNMNMTIKSKEERAGLTR